MAAHSQDLSRAESAFRGGDFAVAERLLKRILAAQPAHSRANELMAYIEGNRGNVARASALLEIATRAEAASATAWYYLGVSFLKAGRFARAVDAFERSLSLDASFFEALHDLGLALFNLGEFAKAVEAYDRALMIKPASFEALHNKGRALCEMDRYDEALAHYDRALVVDPKHAHTWANRGSTLHNLGRHDEALAAFGKAGALQPLADAQWNESLTRLLLGQCDPGWQKYEFRWGGSGRPRLHADVPAWLGAESIEGKRILVWSEQGYGDTIQFCRYVPLLAGLGADVVLEVQPPLKSLVSSVGGCTVIERGHLLPRCDYQIPIGSLPLVFKTTLDTVPASVPYLRASESRLARWRERIGRSDSRPRIGISCSGNAAFRDDRHRPIPLAEFAAIESLARLFLVQTQVRDADRAYLRSSTIEHLGEEIVDFDDSAAIVAQLDLVISIDTSLAHLAGALGKKVWVLLSALPDWRWLLRRTDSPWYPTARLFRQKERGNWSHPMADVANELRGLIAAS